MSIVIKKEFGFQWHISDYCNLRCLHCYQNDFSSKSELDFDSLRALADSVFSSLKDASISVNITGGEPLLSQSFFKLVKYLHGFDNLYEVNIITNGTIASREICEEIGKFSRIGSLKVSIESGSKIVNDSIRGNGVIERTLKGIEAFQRYAKKPIVIMMTLGKHNVNTIGETVHFARDLNLDGIIFERFIPLGTGQKISQEVLGSGEWLAAVNEIANAAETDIDPEDLLPYKAFWLHLKSTEDLLEGALCNLGTESMALMPNGDVYPCRRLPLIAGNLLKDTFESIMKKLSNYEGINLAEKLKGNRCGKCGIDGCFGCRALASADGDLYGDDTQCFLSRNISDKYIKSFK